ncbi:MAG: STAS domain-containing protein [Chlorobi bacterium]|nr:STAS domain-containing protein [Chlorobiota bacterium]
MKTELLEKGHYRLSFHEVCRINVLITNMLSEQVNALEIQPGETLTIDLTGIQFIDTAGFEFLLSMMHDANNTGFRVEFINISPEVAELITLLNLEQLMMHEQSIAY